MFKKITVVIVLILGIFMLTIPFFLPPIKYTYEGKALIETQEEYTDLKIYLSQPSVKIHSISELNSSFPKLITYSFTSKEKQSVLDGIPFEVKNLDFVFISFIPLFFGLGFLPIIFDFY